AGRRSASLSRALISRPWPSRSRRPAEPRPRYPVVWNDYLLALLATALASGLAWIVAHLLELPNISLVFLMAVLLVAVRSSLMPALL
ncbi:DUF4118 domain-containing protein, partial [Pseudomonas aeruginosa]